MFEFYNTECGVAAEITSADRTKVRIRSGESVFYYGDIVAFSRAMACLDHRDLNPAVVQFMQWVDDRAIPGRYYNEHR